MAEMIGYRCAYCGPFETRANPRSARAPAPCPSCGELSPRSYSAPGGRSPRRARQLDGVGAAGRTRIDRAEAGVPAWGPSSPAELPSAADRRGPARAEVARRGRLGTEAPPGRRT